MFCIGEVDDVSKKLVEDTLKAVQLGLSEVRPFNRLGNVGAVINEFAQSQGYKVVRDIGGHGVGLEFRSSAMSQDEIPECCSYRAWYSPLSL